MPNSCHSGKRASGEMGVSKHRSPAHFSDCACQAWLWLAVNAIVVSSEKPLVGFWINKPVCVHRLDRSGYVTILLFKSTLLFLFTCENIFFLDNVSVVFCTGSWCDSWGQGSDFLTCCVSRVSVFVDAWLKCVTSVTAP